MNVRERLIKLQYILSKRDELSDENKAQVVGALRIVNIAWPTLSDHQKDLFVVELENIVDNKPIVIERPTFM